MPVRRPRKRRPKASQGRTAPPQNKVGDWRLSSHGYVTRQRLSNGVRKTEYQHRVNMAEYLGRDLLPHENVHHKNGDKTDNSVGPDGNLELWSKAQPAGQRVIDKVKWAYELIALYDPDGLHAPGAPGF